MSLVLSILIGALSVIVVHEGGHVLAAFLLRGRPRAQWRTLSVSADIEDHRRLARGAFFAAGPVLNLAVGGALLLLGGTGTIPGALHLVFGAANLLPFPAQTDGAALLRLLRQRGP